MNKPEWLQSIVEREEKATPGPWEQELHWGRISIGNSDGKALMARLEEGTPQSKADADFVTHARTDIPTLLSALNKAYEALEVLETEMNSLYVIEPNHSHPDYDWDGRDCEWIRIISHHGKMVHLTFDESDIKITEKE